jgi:hypothetical protein
VPRNHQFVEVPVDPSVIAIKVGIPASKVTQGPPVRNLKINLESFIFII